MKTLLKYAFGFLLAFFAVSASATTLVANYSCNANASTSCMAWGFTLLTASSDLSTWTGVYNQFSINSTSNRSSIIYANSSGYRKVLATNAWDSGVGVTFPSTFENHHYLDAIYDSVSGQVYIGYTRGLGTVSPGPAPIAVSLIKYDLASGTVSSIADYSYGVNGYGVGAQFVSGMAMTRINTTSFAIFYADYDQSPARYTFFRRAYDFSTGNSLASDSTLFETNSTTMTSLVTNGTDILEGYWDVSGNLYYRAFNKALLGQTVMQTLISNTAGTKYGVYFFNSNQSFYTNNIAGNYEIYAIYTNGSNATRMTITPSNEYLYDAFNNTDGTIITVYARDDSFTISANTTCLPSGLSFGTSCGGGVGGQCPNGYYLNASSSCVLLPGNNNQYPDVRLRIWDHACANNLNLQPASVQNTVFDSCTSGGLFELQDWLYLQYTINGYDASPFSVNTSPSQLPVNATCTLQIPSTSQTYTLDAGSLSNPQMWNRPVGTEPSLPYWSVNARNCTAFGNCNDALITSPATLVNVNCNSSMASTDVSTSFYVGNSFKVINTNEFSNGYRGTYNDVVLLNQTPIDSRRVIGTSPASIGSSGGPYGISSNTYCYETFKDIPGYGTYLDAMTYTSTSSSGFNSYSTLLTAPHAINIIPLSQFGGNYRAISSCFVTPDATDSNWRSPSLVISKNFQVKDSCLDHGGYLNSSISVNIRNKAGNLSSQFKTGENAYIFVNYYSGSHPVDKSSCQIQLSDPSNVSQGFLPQLNPNPGQYVTYVLADPTIDDPDYSLIGGQQNFYLSNGTWTISVQCTNLDSNTCILPQSTTKTFAFNTSDTCAGTSDACTLNGCASCGNTQVTCENGRTHVVSNRCTSRQCVPATSGNADVCQGEQLYSISAEVLPSNFPCGTDDAVLRLKLLKQGVVVPPVSELSDLTCSADFGVLVQPVGFNYLFTLPIVPQAGTPYTDFSLVNNIPDLKINRCGQTFEADVTCYSQNFTTGPKKTTANFYIGSIGGNCFVGSQLVKDAECVNRVTGKDADQGLICSSGSIVNNSQLCGCPAGTTLNASTNGCDGPQVFSGAIDFLTFNWLSLKNIFLIIIFGPLVIAVAYLVFKRRG